MESLYATSLREIAAASARDRMLIAARREQEDAMAEAADKVQALLDATRGLSGANVPHALIGGVAVGIHSGVPRATLDVDIAVHSTRDRAEVLRIMTTAGFRLTGRHAHSANFRHPSGEPVQLAFDAVFDPMIERAKSFDVEGVSIPIVSKDDLVATKRRAAADPKRRRSKAMRDRADIELLLGDVPEPDEGW